MLQAFSASTEPYARRHLEAVALWDFGDGIDEFTIEGRGLLDLSTVSESRLDPPFDTKSQYLPASARSIEALAVEQAQILGLGQFGHAGDLVLQDLPTGYGMLTAGDFVVIIGAGAAASNGGGVCARMEARILLNSVLGDGGAEWLSDVLTVDNVTVSSKLAEARIINADTGRGALTDANGNSEVDPGEGIPLIEVLGGSPARAFKMIPVIDNGFMYRLLQDPDRNRVLGYQKVMSVPTLERSGLTLLIAFSGVFVVAGRRLPV